MQTMILSLIDLADKTGTQERKKVTGTLIIVKTKYIRLIINCMANIAKTGLVQFAAAFVKPY